LLDFGDFFDIKYVDGDGEVILMFIQSLKKELMIKRKKKVKKVVNFLSNLLIKK
jgi:hypothetical protein